MTNKEAIEELKKVDTLDMPIRLCEAYYMSLKALEQEPKTGHWIANAPQYDMLNPQYICSECGNAHTRTTPYCEMCGARMVEPQESEIHCNCTDAEIAKSFIEDVEAVKDLLPQESEEV